MRNCTTRRSMVPGGRIAAGVEVLEARRLLSAALAGGGAFQFEPLPASSPAFPGGNPARPLVIPAGFTQTVIAKEPLYADVPDMNTVNETGPDAGRYLYQTHEVGANGSISRIDLYTGDVITLAQRPDWEALDGITWTPWGTILASEETNQAAFPAPEAPQARAGLVYEVDPSTGVAVARPALGSKAHEGLRFDAQGNIYSISEANPGFIFKFTPDRPGDLTSGQLYALKVTQPTGDRTGAAEWVPLDRAAVQVNAGAAAAAAGATGYNRPEDVEISTSTGNSHGGQTLYVNVTGPGDNRTLAIDLREPGGGATHDTAFVYDYVKPGLNVPADFEWPDNVALDKNGNLYIAEDPGGGPPSKVKGDDIWVAEPPNGGPHQPAADVVRFASLTDSNAEPTGIYFDKSGTVLFVNVQHRGGDGRDETVAIYNTDHAANRYFFTTGPNGSNPFATSSIADDAKDTIAAAVLA